MPAMKRMMANSMRLFINPRIRNAADVMTKPRIIVFFRPKVFERRPDAVCNKA